MKAKELVENNLLTNIDIPDGQLVVFKEVALIAINMAREEGANDLIKQASANGQKKHQQGMDFMKYKAIEAYKDTCSFSPDGCCMMKKEAGKCDCEELKNFIEELNS